MSKEKRREMVGLIAILHSLAHNCDSDGFVAVQEHDEDGKACAPREYMCTKCGRGGPLSWWDEEFAGLSAEGEQAVVSMFHKVAAQEEVR